jgi:hypothetical protein
MKRGYEVEYVRRKAKGAHHSSTKSQKNVQTNHRKTKQIESYTATRVGRLASSRRLALAEKRAQSRANQ